MNIQRQRVVVAVTVLAVFATASVTVFAEEGPRGDRGAVARQAAQAQGQVSLAEQYLSRLTAKSKKTRIAAGSAGLAAGALFVGGGLALISGEDDSDFLGLGEFFGAIAVITGGVAVAGGGLALAIPSPAERAYKRIRPIEDPALRETACADALSGLSRNGRKTRMIMGGLACALGVAGVLSSSDGALYSAASAGGLALYSFLVKSPAERTYRAYLEQGGIKPVPDLVLGIGPRGSFRAGLSLDF
jgi:hypothetical protein